MVTEKDFNKTIEEQPFAVQGLVLDGKKQPITSLFISINNLGKEDREKLLKAIFETIKMHKATISKSEEGILILFNMYNKQFNHEMEAVKTAFDIQKETTNNFKTAEIGMGISSGNAIFSNQSNGIINYTCLGNFSILSKKLALSANNEVLITKEVWNRIAGSIKSKFVEKEGIKEGAYSITGVMDRDKYKDYIRSFLQRQADEDRITK